MPGFRSIFLVAVLLAFYLPAPPTFAAETDVGSARELVLNATAVLVDLDLIEVEDAESPEDGAKNPYSLVSSAAKYDADVLRSLEGAVKDLAKALEMDPSLKEAHYRLGVARAALGDTEGAVRTFQKTMELEPERTAVYFHIAELYWKDSRFDDAQKLAAIFLARFPDEKPDALLLSGATYFKEGDFENAAAKALEILSLDPESMDGLLLLGASRYASGNTIKAEEAFSAARKLDPTIARHIMDIKWGIDRKIY